MLPFLKIKQEAGVAGTIMKQRKPDEKPADEVKDDPSAGLHACVEEFMKALERKDVKAAVEALKDCMSLIDTDDSEDDKTAPPPHSYEAQNRLAAKTE